MPAEHDDERGQATLLALCALVIVALVTVLVATVVVAATDQARAQHAADAAALAGVTGGPSAAGQLARANGAELVGYERGPGRAGGAVRVTVVVRRGDRTARASAEGDPIAEGPGP
jgi:Flp pilus assembly protein TadG